jgi:hypothetical protein
MCAERAERLKIRRISLNDSYFRADTAKAMRFTQHFHPFENPSPRSSSKTLYLCCSKALIQAF